VAIHVIQCPPSSTLIGLLARQRHGGDFGAVLVVMMAENLGVGHLVYVFHIA